MDKKNLKVRALKQLARTPGQEAQAAVDKELLRIQETLVHETNYNVLDADLELLEEIAFRAAGKSIEILKAFLERLGTFSLTFDKSEWYSEERFKEHFNEDALSVKSLEIMRRVRYHEPEKVLSVFWAYSQSSSDNIKKAAEEGVQALAKYDLDVFYKTDDFPGLGAAPQRIVLESIKALGAQQRQDAFNAIILACKEILSPTMEGTYSTYKTLTLRTGAVPAAHGIPELRDETLDILVKLYELATSDKHRRDVINTLQDATRTPTNVNYKYDLQNMVAKNTVRVLDFYLQIVSGKDLMTVQQIEHDSFWLFKHSISDAVREAALKIGRAIEKNEEYQIFKVLIGFEGVFDDWESEEEADYEEIDQLRDTRAKEFAQSVTEKNYDLWKSRILSYSSIKSEDLATFPVFGKFLEYLAAASPSLGLRLISEEEGVLRGFVVPLLIGIWSSKKDAALELIFSWIDEQKNLFSIGRLLEVKGITDEKILSGVLHAAIQQQDRFALIQLVSAVARNLSTENKHLLQSIYLPSIQALTALKEGRWVNDFWYRREGGDLLAHFDEPSCRIILENMVYLNEISYRAEEVLIPIAKKFPSLVIEFFGWRLRFEDKDDREKYEAIPYQFHKLHKTLSAIPKQALAIVTEWYKPKEYGMFILTAGRLIENIFPDFSEGIRDALIEYARSGDNKKIMVALAVLRSYDGQEFIQPVCKELIMALPVGDDLLNEVWVAMQATGVVGGAFGFAEAYERKANEIRPWLNDPNEKIRKFAADYISGLEKDVTHERRRAEEEIELRKYEWGDDTETK